MVFIAILAVGWVLATAAVYCLLVRRRWLTKFLMLGASAVAGVVAGMTAARALGPIGWPGLPFAAGAIVFTVTAEALLLVWGVQRFGKP